ncbi:MAG: PKD domain-containing protein [Ferruginibacter sp.]
MRHAFILLIFLVSFAIADAKHITGGEMIYQYTGQATPTSKYYRITLRLFRDENCTGCADMPASVSIGVFNNDDNALYGSYRTINISSTETLPLNTLPSCITNPPTLNYRGGNYVFLIELPNNNKGFTATYQTCCRIDGIRNVPNSVGATYIAQIPGMNTLGSGGTDNSPQFSKGISVVCYNKPFTLDFSAFDNNLNDSLVYSLCAGFAGGQATDASYSTPAAPPYNTLNYINGFTGTSPMGPLATINSETGIISGIAPDAGKYVVSVCVATYRNGNYIGQHRKDFIITVAPCDFAGAQLQPSYLSCDGFTFNFDNLNNSPLNVSWFWDFGDGTTSTDQAPVHTYTTAGVYTIKLVVNMGNSCSDSTTSQLKVFPGYFPKFSNNSPMCKGIPVSFKDETIATYGAANKWQWDFGDPSVATDISTLKNPVYTYQTPGTYLVELTVESDKGCIGTFKDSVTITDKPQFTITNDTLICSIDTIQLSAMSNSGGSVTWSPNYNISNVNSFTPLAWPKVTTTYTVNFSDNFGCSATDQVTVNVVDSVTLIAMRDTTICTTDAVTLQVNSNALRYTWTPAATLNNAFIKNPIATPLTSTLYQVRGTIGKCETNDQVNVRTVNYPVVNVSPDPTICFGTNTQLVASGGSIYSWSPTSFLSATNIPNPIAVRPTSSLNYIVSVRDTLGCPKPVSKTIRLTVVKIIADAGPKDTSVVLGQPLQLLATGSEFYSWDPPIWLNNAFIPNPVALPQDNILYTVTVSDATGCFGKDSINVKLFKIEPDLLVPSGFSPDGDGLNDIFRPIPIGMRAITAFRVYNRWGQLIFSTTEQGRGWDGKLSGNPQDTGTYVWYAEGIDYTNKKIQRKGYVVLIR